MIVTAESVDSKDDEKGDRMSDILEEANSVVECQECSWYKSCVMPMRMSIKDVLENLQHTLPGSMPDDSLLLNSAATAQSMILEGCPVFIKRLKSNSKLSEQLKEMMKNWSGE